MSLKDKNYNTQLMEAVNDCEGWDCERLALAECYRRALDDKNRDVKEAVLKYKNRDNEEWFEIEGYGHCSAGEYYITIKIIKGSRIGEYICKDEDVGTHDYDDIYDSEMEDYIFTEIFGDFEK